ncbi:SDR family oxidoreductase [Epibacterium ulvae]|uniref:NAD(P)-dependent oxidoreductase n=1 Tax=Epibacterium ulvae TaxID=1156985 RepID=UPI001BFCB830|nr:NAD(P)-binding oxidoreductase [Epibacterium ulvae]MBT8156043.1 SDR family oxidoreductase [Epibacterium ulvae]
MKVIVFGATGSLGRHVVKSLLAKGHAVTGFSRSGQWVEDDVAAGLTMLRGDVLNPLQVAEAIDGQDAVVCALGAGMRGEIRTKGTEVIVNAMSDTGVKRLICLSSMGVGDSEPVLNFWWRRVMFGLLLRAAFADHHSQETLVRQSDLDWTIVRPGAFQDGDPLGEYHVGDLRALRGKLALKIRRADVADFMARQIDSMNFLHQSPSLSY